MDATVGGGGHARALLAAHPHLRLVGLDQDADAVAAARQALAGFADRVELHHIRFDALADPGRGPAPTPVSGALFDLGVSSHQLDTADRGFSFRADAPLDMRMDTSRGRTAAEVVNTIAEAELVALLRAHGEAQFAPRIAKAIIAARPVETTARLADVVAAAVPHVGRRKGNPATRVFQALRVTVNAELDILAPTLDAVIERLAPGGRLVVLSYHSGEDRIVKSRFLQAATGGCTCPPALPCGCGATPTVRLLTRGARMPDAAEVRANPRASAARLRAVEKLEV